MHHNDTLVLFYLLGTFALTEMDWPTCTACDLYDAMLIGPTDDRLLLAPLAALKWETGQVMLAAMAR